MATSGTERTEAADSQEIDLRSIPPATEFVVETRNSRYRCVMLEGNGQTVLVEGGQHFPRVTTARIEGATLGESAIAVGRIKVGLRMELCAGKQRFVTSPVQSISLEAA